MDGHSLIFEFLYSSLAPTFSRFGRLPAMVAGTQLGFVFATIKTFPTNYTMFIAVSIFGAITIDSIINFLQFHSWNF